MINYPLYLVPFDFSHYSDSALKLSLELAHANDGHVYLLNVAREAKDKPAVRHKFKNLISNLDDADKNIITANVIVGTGIYDEIGKASDLLRPSLIVMGTRGAKGLQKIFGSHVEKIISYSSSPVLVTQGEKEVKQIKNIIMPFDFSKESLQVTTFAGAMAKNFGAKMHLVGRHDNVEIHEDKVKSNQAIVKRFMVDNGVECEIAELPNKHSFDKEILNYAEQVGADIIAMTYSNDHFMRTTNQFAQSLIENNLSIPVLTVNSEELSQTYY